MVTRTLPSGRTRMTYRRACRIRTKRIVSSGSSKGSPGCTSVREVLLQPAEDLFMPQLAVERLQHPVPLVLEDESFARHAAAAERGEQLQSLVHGDAEIQLIGDDHRRRLQVRGGTMRRQLHELLARGGAGRY